MPTHSYPHSQCLTTAFCHHVLRSVNQQTNFEPNLTDKLTQIFTMTALYTNYNLCIGK